MEQITLRIPSELLDRIDDTADEHGKSRSEYVRELLETHTGHDEMQVTPERVRELEDALVAASEEVEQLETECDRVHREKRQILDQQQEHGELVRYAEEDRLRQRAKDQAGIVTRAKWVLWGMPDTGGFEFPHASDGGKRSED